MIITVNPVRTLSGFTITCEKKDVTILQGGKALKISEGIWCYDDLRQSASNMIVSMNNIDSIDYLN